MTNWILILPSGLWAMAVTALGRWGEHRFFEPAGDQAPKNVQGIWGRLTATLLVCLLLYGVLPALIIFVFQPMLPFEEAHIGLALGLGVYVLGLVPARLLDAPRRGWDHAAYTMLFDFFRTVGALVIAGWLLGV